jgi:hypothetical protein
MKKLILALLLVSFTSPAGALTVYRWADSAGVVHLTDDPGKVPPPYRDRVETQVLEEVPGKPPQSPSGPPPTAEKAAPTDNDGHNEAWWQARVRPLREKLREAGDDYEKALQRFVEGAEQLSRMRFGSRTQYKSKIIELDGANEAVMKEKDRIAEIEEGLVRLSKEATEANANPDWLK